LQGALELGDIERKRRAGMPAERARVGMEKAIGRRQRTAQLVNQLAQVITGLGFVRIGPEEESEVLPWLGNIAMQYKVGEQRLQARRGDGRHPLVAVGKAAIAQQLDA
jgi:hypothetical protein